jgi:hypothetical protein
MKTIKEIQERIEQIDQEIYDSHLGVRLATTQEIAFKVSDEIRPMLNLLVKERDFLNDKLIQLTRK